MKLLSYYIIIIFFGTACSSEKDDYVPIVPENKKLEFTIPANFPNPSYNVSLNPPTEKGFELGKKLFYDGRLSSDGVISCGFCHIQDFAFTHHTHIVSHGVDGALGTRNAQPLHNLAFMKEFTWDGAARHLDLQPIIPITAEVEMNETFSSIIKKLEEKPEYVQLFAAAFENQKINSENILKALSQFMIMMISSNSKYDKIERNEGSVFTDNEAAGFELFKSKCASCHAGTLFTDQSYRNNGLAVDPLYNDIGRNRVTGLAEDMHKFKVPTLRNVELTFPYMHDGRLKTLDDVLNHYSDGVVDSETLEPLFKNQSGTLGIPMTTEEKQQIIAFLKTLTDDNFLNDDRFSEF
ncbi:cytochrome-c peroxidase [Aquimarina sp. AD10]|uniref:cytochrome-c peroxidase n=1 Tax=Aquimarina sp. AD10 TaxID=1714849 RepID=UPI000E4F1E6A|nr:cytochrome c peroxidase [Aquimarina sp. AD10]AXT61929.1 cytochrome-c peroxidase [Aquimarina sp. AD10]RKN02389.1 cytochrome-c peroxidase [Aquimarina sp. AD10]